MATNGDGIDNDGYDAMVETLYGDVTPVEILKRIVEEAEKYKEDYGKDPEVITIRSFPRFDHGKPYTYTEARVVFS